MEKGKEKESCLRCAIMTEEPLTKEGSQKKGDKRHDNPMNSVSHTLYSLLPVLPGNVTEVPQHHPHTQTPYGCEGVLHYQVRYVVWRVSSATVVEDTQYVEQCECDKATTVCPVHRSESCDHQKWTTIGRKAKSERPGRLPRLQASTLEGFGSHGLGLHTSRSYWKCKTGLGLQAFGLCKGYSRKGKSLVSWIGELYKLSSLIQS
jgi:hypothetical protein